MIVRRIGVLSAAKVAGALYGLMGLLLGALFSLLSLVGTMAAMGEGNDEAIFGVLFGVGAVVILPIFYGVIGAIFAAIAAVFYNVIAGLVGGLEIELDSVSGGAAPIAARPDSPY
ncbi:MAG: hypothetical protein MPN21_21140 [Thermoanaerobaculia bacterium]|nr:hypothetical protein [Thermoanaerobaculia bacterium]